MKNRRTGITIQCIQNQRAFASLIDRSLTTNGSSSFNSYPAIAFHNYNGWRNSLTQIHINVTSGIKKYIFAINKDILSLIPTLTLQIPIGSRRIPGQVRLIGINIHHTSLHRTSCHGEFWRIFRILAGISKSSHSYQVSYTRFQALDGIGSTIGCHTGHFLPLILTFLRYFNAESIFCIGIVTPFQLNGRTGRRNKLYAHWHTEEIVAVSYGNAIDIILNISITISSNHQGIILVRVGTISLFPSIRHTIAIAIYLLVSAPNRPFVRRTIWKIFLICQ